MPPLHSRPHHPRRSRSPAPSAHRSCWSLTAPPPLTAEREVPFGVYATVEENTLLRDAGYTQMGLDPADPSGELTDPDAPPVVAGEAAPTNVDAPFRGAGRGAA
jgi:hypothetical protein